MKITKKILISSLAITPLATLAFIPSIVRPKEVKTYSNNYTENIYSNDIYNSQPDALTDIIKELFKEFDIDISFSDSKLLATKIEEKRNELNEKIIANKNKVKELENILKLGNDAYYDQYDLKLRKFCVNNLNYKLKLLEEIENNLLSKIMKDDYKNSMRKYYSAEALAITIDKILKEAKTLEGIIKNYKGSNLYSKDKETAKEMTKWLSIDIGKKIEILNMLNAHRKILEKHFPINRDMIKQYYQLALRSSDDDINMIN